LPGAKSTLTVQGFAGVVGLDDSAPDADPAVITGCKTARNRPLTCGQKLSDAGEETEAERITRAAARPRSTALTMYRW
jgi:hypothetical protein